MELPPFELRMVSITEESGQDSSVDEEKKKASRLGDVFSNEAGAVSGAATAGILHARAYRTFDSLSEDHGLGVAVFLEA
jgi:alcohol dehydrogenase class IV